MASLAELRIKIDETDERIVRALDERARLVLQVKDAKQKEEIEIYSPERERQILERVTKLAESSPFPKPSLKKIFTEIVSATRSLIGELVVAFLEPQHSASYEAAVKQFGERVTYHPGASVEEVFLKVDQGDAHFGIVPAEMNSSGVLVSTFRCFHGSSLQIIAEIAEQSSRFIVIGLSTPSRTGVDKTSIVCSAPEKPGALREILEPFQENNLTLSKVESKFMEGGHVFFIDIVGHITDKPVASALEKVQRLTSNFRVLGSYGMTCK